MISGQKKNMGQIEKGKGEKYIEIYVHFILS